MGPSEEFQSHWEAVAKVVIAGVQDEKAMALVEALLSGLSVGYVDMRSQTFFPEHRRLLLRGPYAQVLQLAGALLDRSRREELLTQTSAIVETPREHPDRIWAASDALKDEFLGWLAQHGSLGFSLTESVSVIDHVDGFAQGDAANPEIRLEFSLDKDAEMELGAKFWHEQAPENRWDINDILANLLRLEAGSGEDSGAAQSRAEALAPTSLAGKRSIVKGAKQDKSGVSADTKKQRWVDETEPAVQPAADMAAHPTASELLQLCVDDLLAEPA